MPILIQSMGNKGDILWLKLSYKVHIPKHHMNKVVLSNWMNLINVLYPLVLLFCSCGCSSTEPPLSLHTSTADAPITDCIAAKVGRAWDCNSGCHGQVQRVKKERGTDCHRVQITAHTLLRLSNKRARNVERFLPFQWPRNPFVASLSLCVS